MAILSANFSADFSKFQAAVEGAQSKMKSFESDAGKVAEAMTRMENSISGVKIVQAATVAAEAVERLGGVSKLTYAELQRLGGTAQQAVDKMTALGQAVPTNIQALADQAKNAAESMTKLGTAAKETQGSTMNWAGALSTATGLLGAMGIQASIGGIIQFGKSVIDTGGAINDMAARVGISTEAIQGFKFAAEQGGSSMETVSTAIAKLNNNLATGDKSTVEALTRAGLKFADIRAMKSEDAFLAVTDALEEMDDGMEATAAGVELLGKGFIELKPAIDEGFRAAADGATKMSAETVAALARAGDAWDAFGSQVTIITGTIIADTMDFAKQSTSSLTNFTQFLLDAIKMGPGAAMALQAMNEKLDVMRAGDYYGPVQQGAKAIGETKENADAAAKAYDTWKKATDELALSGGGWQTTLDTMSGTTVEAIKFHYLAAGVSQGTLAAAYGVTDSQVKAVDSAMKDAIGTQKEWDELAKKQNEFNQKGMEATANETKKRTAEVNAAVIDGNKQIMDASAALKDFQMKNSMDTTSYQVVKVWEGVDAQVKAFEAEGHSAEQVARYKTTLWEQAAARQLQIEQDAYGSMKDMSEAMLTDVVAVANKLKGITDASLSAARAAHAEMQTYQGGVSRPGSREEYAFGQRFVITPDGRRIAIGAHGELPDNFDSMYGGGSNFSSGTSNQARIGTGFNVPQFGEGGVGDFGSGTLAMLHGLEAIVPLDRAPTPVGPASLPSLAGGFEPPAPVQIVVNVTQPLGTPQQIADVVGQAIMTNLRGQGMRAPSSL